MRGVLAARGDKSRKVWVADSFQGLPPPDAAKYPLDAGYNFHEFPQLAIPLEQVQSNFAAYGLLDEQVRFVKGWFRDTLSTIPAERFALIRLDGDLYESTIQALDALYPKLSPGGFCIIDDYEITACRQAVADYRKAHGIEAPMKAVDWTGSYWRKPL
ncbi:MAG TPA: TylF/MycF/NovP-related O-methyltransferase [Xanthobacteraceae bacterium]|jgi:O-methyltransferase